jgi:hypothetical protein
MDTNTTYQDAVIAFAAAEGFTDLTDAEIAMQEL